MSQDAGGGDPPGPETQDDQHSPESRTAQPGAGAGAGAAERAGKHDTPKEKVQIVLGKQYDVLDASSRWCEGEVLQVGAHKVLITYVYWDSQFDEWIANVADR
jgi:hypothetical protein